MAEKIERMELDFESRDKVQLDFELFVYMFPLVSMGSCLIPCAFSSTLWELQELYNSQQLLTSELSDKLEKTEV